MEYLYEIGLNDEQIKNIIVINNDLLNLSIKETKMLIGILRNIGCSELQIKNIVESNPFYLSRSKTDIEKLILKLQSLGIERLEITFDSNPWLLNKDDFEIDQFIMEKRKEKMGIDEIIDLIDSGMID